jgi:hypothetical protein
VLQNVLHTSGPAALPFLAALSAKRKPGGLPRAKRQRASAPCEAFHF